jgi:FHA domain-containing protein
LLQSNDLSDYRARLVVSDGDSRVVDITKPRFTIGRAKDADLYLSDRDVSREHAEITAADGVFVLTDTNSLHGTFVNDLPATGLSSGEIPHVANQLLGLSALGPERVVNEVLALVLDSAIEVTGAERGLHDRRALHRRRPAEDARPRGDGRPRHSLHPLRAAVPGALRRAGLGSHGRAPNRRALPRQPGAGRRALDDHAVGHRRAVGAGGARHRERAALSRDAPSSGCSMRRPTSTGPSRWRRETPWSPSPTASPTRSTRAARSSATSVRPTT